MMLWYLLKKDILIIKKYVLIMLAAAVLIPPFMLWRVPEYAGILGFMLSGHFLRFNPAAIYLFKRISISKGSLSAMRSNFFTKNDGIVPVHFLYCRLCGLLHHLYH